MPIGDYMTLAERIASKTSLFQQQLENETNTAYFESFRDIISTLQGDAKYADITAELSQIELRFRGIILGGTKKTSTGEPTTNKKAPPETWYPVFLKTAKTKAEILEACEAAGYSGLGAVNYLEGMVKAKHKAIAKKAVSGWTGRGKPPVTYQYVGK